MSSDPQARPQEPLGTGWTVVLTILGLTLVLPVLAVGMIVFGLFVMAFIDS